MDQRTYRSSSAQDATPGSSEQAADRRHTLLGYALALFVLIDVALLLLLIVLLAGSAQPLKTIAIIVGILALMLSGPLLMLSVQATADLRSRLRSVARNKVVRNAIFGVTGGLIVIFAGALFAGFPVDSPKLASMRAAIFERPSAIALPADGSKNATPRVTDPAVAAMALVSPISTAAFTATSAAPVATTESTSAASPEPALTMAPEATATIAPPPTATPVPSSAPIASAPTETVAATSSPTATPSPTPTTMAVTPSPTVSDEQAQTFVREAMNAANGALIAWLKDTTQSTDTLKPYYCGDPAWKSVTAFMSAMAARAGDAVTAHYTATDLSAATQETDNRWRLQQTENWTYAGQGWELKGQAETYAYWVIEKTGAAQRFCIDEYKLVKP